MLIFDLFYFYIYFIRSEKVNEDGWAGRVKEISTYGGEKIM